jgi:hypothetical protein
LLIYTHINLYKKLTPSKIEEIISGIGIPLIVGDKTGTVIRTSGAGRAGGRSDLTKSGREKYKNVKVAEKF